MIIEYTYSQHDLKKKCYGCKWLKLDSDKWNGECICESNSVKKRHRYITDKACSWKNATQIKMFEEGVKNEN